MNAAVCIRSPVGHISGPATTRPHCFIETSGKFNDFVKLHLIKLAKHALLQVGKEVHRAKVTCKLGEDLKIWKIEMHIISTPRIMRFIQG